MRSISICVSIVILDIVFRLVFSLYCCYYHYCYCFLLRGGCVFCSSHGHDMGARIVVAIARARANFQDHLAGSAFVMFEAALEPAIKPGAPFQKFPKTS